ncbi:hypothetical protein [Sediminitomix flava]|uniref:Uncharacterized protein n=1 Tax=Sediminitomix flava TaxID=379075 RepID=A0A315ZH20_SEDFL|nr:hypothetical protein [Sediminitomix flava]PWJ44469.1 hypothetical protein BC781_101840 [Sediminitomix flava]
MTEQNQEQDIPEKKKIPQWIFFVFIPLLLISLIGIVFWWNTSSVSPEEERLITYLKENIYLESPKEVFLNEEANFQLVIPITNIQKLQKQKDSLNRLIQELELQAEEEQNEVKSLLTPYFPQLQNLNTKLASYKNVYQNEDIVRFAHEHKTDYVFKKLYLVSQEYKKLLTQNQIFSEQFEQQIDEGNSSSSETLFALNNLIETQSRLLALSIQLKKKLFLFEYQYNQLRHPSSPDSVLTILNNSLDESYVLTQDALYKYAILKDQGSPFIRLLRNHQRLTNVLRDKLQSLVRSADTSIQMDEWERITKRIESNIISLNKLSVAAIDYKIIDIKVTDANKLLDFSNQTCSEIEDKQVWEINSKAKKNGKTSVQFEVNGELSNKNDDNKTRFSIKVIENLVNISEN